MIRGFLFRVFYWITSVFFTLTAVPLLILPTRMPLARWIFLYTKTMRLWLHWIGGVKVIIRNKHFLPDGPCIIGAKHQSWGDGIIMFSEIFDLAFVSGNHLERLPLLSAILRKLGAIVVDNCGGAVARARLVANDELVQSRDEGRRILIYPEGNLAPIGRRYRYRRGIFHMYQAYDKAAVPVATNLGAFWPQQSWRLNAGTAIVEFLEPIPPGLEKIDFMKILEDRIESRSLALLDLSETQMMAARAMPPVDQETNPETGTPAAMTTT